MKAQLKKELEEKQERIVINAREKILPVLKSNELKIQYAKLVCNTLAIAISQGQFDLLKKHKVSDLNLLDLIKEGYPQYDTVVELIKNLNDFSMEEAINCLQWMTEKINKLVEEENEKRSIIELGLDF